MNKKVKKLWTDALRSGKYKQGHGMLNDTVDNTYCCLGVLCVLHAKVTKKKGFDIIGKYMDEHETLPYGVAEWAELKKSKVGFHNPKIGKYSALELNDYLDKSFNEIADLIDKHL